MRPVRDETIRVMGSDPIRVLLVGAGLAASYGVDEHRHGLAGHLAAALAEQSGRGVVVQTRTVPLMPARRAVRTIGTVGAHSYDAVVFAGCHLESPLAPNTALGAHIEAVLEHLIATGAPRLRIAVTGLPSSDGTSRMDSAVATAVARSNHRVKDAVEHRSRAIFVPTPAFHSIHDPHPFDARYYRQAARAIVEDGLHHYSRRSTRAVHEEP